MEKLLWKALVAVAQGKVTAWTALGQFICEAPWDIVEQATGEVRSWFAPGARFFTSLQHPFLMGSGSASDSEGDAQADDNVYCIDLEGPIPKGWPLEILPPAISSEGKALSSNATNSLAASSDHGPLLPEQLMLNQCGALPEGRESESVHPAFQCMPKANDSESPAVAEMDIDEGSSSETESLAAKIAAAYNSAPIAAAGSSAFALGAAAGSPTALAGLGQNQPAEGRACLHVGMGTIGSGEKQGLFPQRVPSARNGGITSPSIENHPKSTCKAIRTNLKDPAESDLTDLDPNPSDHSSSGEDSTHSDTDSESGSEALERENSQRKFSRSSKSWLMRKPRPLCRTRETNSAHVPRPDSFGSPSAPLSLPPRSGKRKFPHNEDCHTNIERPSGSIDLDAAMVSLVFCSKCF